MKCQECHDREAALHVKETINGEIHEAYLCEICAAKKSPFHSHDTGQKIFNLHQLLSGMMELEEKPTGRSFEQGKKLQCPHCKMTYDQFAGLSRFGCARCYTAFRDKIKPLFRKIHGNSEHRGKVPKQQSEEFSIHRKIKTLKAKMQRAIEEENFEEAAKLRDEIKDLEKDL